MKKRDDRLQPELYDNECYQLLMVHHSLSKSLW